MRQKPPSIALSPLNRVLSPSLGLIPDNTPPRLFADALSHFSAIPWCAERLGTKSSSSPSAASSSDSSSLPGGSCAVITFIPQCFNPASPKHDQFVGATLAHAPRGLKQMLCYFRPQDAEHLHDPSRPITCISSLWALDEGLSGYEGILHGGMTTTMVDETLGVIHEINTALGKSGSLFAASSVTASLSIKFLRPIPVEGAVCVTASVEAMEGRKTRLKAEVVGATGETLAVAESVWIAVRAKV
ncbi:thioesterase family protein [Drechmeria coniospora]|uniref:Thioesterase family protein n=1 Tax=Drechmeria coniospora TaxID=98403 RepID=A0A151GPM9_DRECN|nr:thioesterase family protein [Drechmeria coniospora]KYK59064.1 thioesterase family protein [Drechmeria coniospora]